MDIIMENDPIERLRYLLGNFNSLQSNIDMYAQFIKSELKKKEKEDS